MTIHDKIYNTEITAQLFNTETGDVYRTNSVTAFAKEFGLNYYSLRLLVIGKTKKCGVWILDPNRGSDFEYEVEDYVY